MEIAKAIFDYWNMLWGGIAFLCLIVVLPAGIYVSKKKQKTNDKQ